MIRASESAHISQAKFILGQRELCPWNLLLPALWGGLVLLSERGEEDADVG